MPTRSNAVRLVLLLLALALVSPAQVTMETSAVQQAWALSDQAHFWMRERRAALASSASGSSLGNAGHRGKAFGSANTTCTRSD